MPLRKAIPLLLLAIASVLALSATPASADAICEDTPESTESGWLCHLPYPTSEKYEATSAKVTLTGEAFEVSCESSLTLATQEDLGNGKGLKGKLESLTFSGCKGCTKATATNLPYTALVSGTEKGNGTVTLSNGEKQPGISLEGCFVGKCSYSAEKVSMTFKGGEPGFIEATKAPFKRTSGLCPLEGSFTGSYQVQRPRAFAAAGPVPATVLCKAAQALCAVGNRFPAAENYEAKVIGAGIKFKWGGMVKNTCTVSVFKFSTTTIAAPMLAKVTLWSFPTCDNCVTTAERLPWKATIEAETIAGNGNGKMELSSGGSGTPLLKIVCGGVTCSWEAAALIPTITGNTPSTLNFATSFFTDPSGTCAALEIEVGNFQFQAPNANVWPARV